MPWEESLGRQEGSWKTYWGMKGWRGDTGDKDEAEEWERERGGKEMGQAGRQVQVSTKEAGRWELEQKTCSLSWQAFQRTCQAWNFDAWKPT